MKNLARKAALRSGILRVAGRLNGRGAAILMYHSVMEDPLRHQNLLGRTVHSRTVFRAQMELLARRYRPISLDEIGRFVRDEGALPSRTVAVTFDDGYADNYEIAAPVLNELGIPATFYVTVDCMERRRMPWPSRLRFAFQATKKRTWADSSGNSWPLSGEVEREDALLRSCDECCKLAGASQDDYVANVESELDARAPVESGDLMMTYDQVRGLVRQGHIVGSHTMTHPNMAQISSQELNRELTESKSIIERELRATVEHFSYPCPALSPHWTEQTVSASRDAGYRIAVTTDGGLARKGDNPLKLKRTRPSRSAEGLQWNLECAFAGRAV